MIKILILGNQLITGKEMPTCLKDYWWDNFCIENDYKGTVIESMFYWYRYK